MTFIERYFYKPNWAMRWLSWLLLPFSFCLWLVSLLRAKEAAADFGVKVVSVGNLTLGGSGKTPVTLALFEELNARAKCFVVLRGYGRKSRGLLVVSQDAEIFCDTPQSGDEAMLLAQNGVNVIVSEDRVKGIEKAKELGAKIVLLDDGFRHFDIKKFDLLLPPPFTPANDFCFPSGCYRMAKRLRSRADLALEQEELQREFALVRMPQDLSKSNLVFTRQEELLKEAKEANLPPLLMLSAIANPSRLAPFYELCVGKIHLKDHGEFSKEWVCEWMRQCGAEALLVTEKDFVKMRGFGVEIFVLKMRVRLPQRLLDAVLEYVKER